MSYCSDAYGGAASDRQIVERSSLAQMCDPGDSLMADKGFNVQDLFENVDVKINIPSFFKGTPSIPETYLLSSVAWGLNLRVG